MRIVEVRSNSHFRMMVAASNFHDGLNVKQGGDTIIVPHTSVPELITALQDELNYLNSHPPATVPPHRHVQKL